MLFAPVSIMKIANEECNTANIMCTNYESQHPPTSRYCSAREKNLSIRKSRMKHLEIIGGTNSKLCKNREDMKKSFSTTSTKTILLVITGSR